MSDAPNDGENHHPTPTIGRTDARALLCREGNLRRRFTIQSRLSFPETSQVEHKGDKKYGYIS